MIKPLTRHLFTAGALLLAACTSQARPDPAATPRLAPVPAHEWPSHGGDSRSQRYSPLAAINTGNVGQLGLAWWVDLDTLAGQEATPIMVDGVLYFSSAYSVVRAVDARTGQTLWTYDPQVMAFAARSCCGPVSRGVAVADGRVFVGALDGRLVALDAATGSVVWQVQTFDGAQPTPENYAITGAPRVVRGRVIIGNGGGGIRRARLCQRL